MTHPAHENIIAGFTFPGKYAAIKRSLRPHLIVNGTCYYENSRHFAEYPPEWRLFPVVLVSIHPT